MAGRSKSTASPAPFRRPEDFAVAVLERAHAERELGETSITGYLTAYVLAKTFDSARRGSLMSPSGNPVEPRSITGKKFAEEFTKAAYQAAAQNGTVVLADYREDASQMVILAEIVALVFDRHQEALKLQRRT